MVIKGKSDEWQSKTVFDTGMRIFHDKSFNKPDEGTKRDGKG